MRFRLFSLSILLIAFSSILGQSTEQTAIEDLFLKHFQSHWQSGDAEKLAELWHPEGDWMSLVGSRRIFSGREKIAQVWQVGLQGRDTAEKKQLVIEIDNVQMLGEQLAQADMVMTFGHESTGVLKEAMSVIVRKSEADWQVLSCRVARIFFTPGKSE